MFEIIIIFFSGVLGILFGIMNNNSGILKLVSFKSVKTKDKSVKTKEITYTKSYPTVIDFESSKFSKTELNILRKLIHLNDLQLPLLIEKNFDLFNLDPRSKSSRRTQVNRILKKLNLKLLFIYGIQEGIFSLNTEKDKRIRCFFIKDELIVLGIANDVI
jgi:hypothetical protein